MNLFKRKTRKEKLEKRYKQKLSEAHKMSTINRSKADQLIFEAEEIRKEMEGLK
jgi:hypothetical protein